MIRITPYYERQNEEEKKKILELYLNMVADVVPFLPEDVLYEVRDTTKKERPTRKRTAEYKALLNGINGEGLTRKEQDALLARKLIEEYSPQLHKYLYEGIENDSPHVNPSRLNELLTVKMPEGKLPDHLQFEFNAVSEAEEPDKEIRKDKNVRRKKSLVKYVFRYEDFSKLEAVYDFITMYNVQVCPYCNRQYITTARTQKGSKSDTPESPEEREKRTRPQLDHFKNKNAFPWLALSINNLVPSCGVCNLLKHDKDEGILYPFSEGMGSVFVFKTVDNDGQITSVLTGARRAFGDFDVKLLPTVENINDELRERAEQSIRTFLLEEVYQIHKKYITSMYFQRYVNTDEFLMDRVEQFPELFRPIGDTGGKPLEKEKKEAAFQELKRAIFLMDYTPEAWGDRPLAKLTHDIEKEIEALIQHSRRTPAQ